MRFFDLSESELRSCLKTSIAVSATMLAVWLGLSEVLATELAAATALPIEGFRLACVAAALHGIFYVILALLQFRASHRTFLAAQIAQSALAVAIILPLVLHYRSWTGAAIGRILALIVVDLVFVRIVLTLFAADDGKTAPAPAFQKLITAGVRFVPVGLLPVVVPLTGRVVVTHVTGPTETGYLGIGSLFGSVLLIVAQGLIYAWQPYLFREESAAKDLPAHDGISRRHFRLLYFTAITASAVMVGMLATLIAPAFIGYALEPIRPYIWLMCAAACSECYFLHNQTVMHARRRLTLLLVTSVSIATANLCLTLWLVPRVGGLGAAWSTALVYLMGTAISGVFLIRGR